MRLAFNRGTACDRENKIKWMQSRVAFNSQSNVSLGDQSFFIAVGEGEGVRILKRVIWFSGETGEISRHQQSIKGGTLDNWLPIWGGFQKIKESRRGSGQSYLYTTKILRTSLPPLPPPPPSVINKDQYKRLQLITWSKYCISCFISSRFLTAALVHDTLVLLSCSVLPGPCAIFRYLP